jgi:hypothetical protein
VEICQWNIEKIEEANSEPDKQQAKKTLASGKNK